jgi:hypothetical protein
VPVEKVSNQGIFRWGKALPWLNNNILSIKHPGTPETMIEVDPKTLLNPEDEDYDSTGYDTSTAFLTSSI